MRTLLLVLVAGSLGACSARGRALVESGERSGGSPTTFAGAADAFPPEVVEAERQLRAGRGDLAEDVLVRAGGLSAADPERSWLLVEVWGVRCAVAHAREQAAALPDSPMAAVLRAQADGEPEAVLKAVRPLEGGPAAGWAHLAAAIALAEEGGRSEAVERHAQRAVALGPVYVRREALLVAAREALEADRGLEALDLARRAAGVDPSDPRPPAFASRIAARVGRRTDAVLEAVEALRLQPQSGRAARRLADLMREDPGDAAEARAKEAVSALLASRGGSPPPGPELLALGGLLADRAGEAPVAIDRYQRGLAAGADPVPVDRRLRRLLFAAGRRREAVALLRRAAPPAVVARPTNEQGPSWRALDQAAAAVPDGPVPPARAGALLSLARALAALGAVDDAEATASADPSPAGKAFAARCRAEAAFEGAMRARVEEGYRAPATGGKAPPLARLLEEVRDAARRLLPPEEAADFETPLVGARDVPLLGTWLDHSAATTSPVVAHFRKWGKYLVLGQRTGKPSEAILLSLAFLEAGARIDTQGRTFRHDLAVGYDREMRSFVDFQGGGLSGAALPDGLWLDADAARREDAGLRSAMRLDAPLLARIRAVVAAPPEPDGIEGPFALDDPAGVAYRLVARYFERAGSDPWGSFDVLYAHESGHVLDLRRHLPLSKGLGASAHLLASEGLSLDKAEARLEGRAQLASVRDAPAPDLALVDLVRPLPIFERTPEAHDRGYRDVVVRMLARLYADRARYPAIDPTKKLLPQLDRLTPEEIRALARDVAGE